MKITTTTITTILVMRIFVFIAASRPELQFKFHDQSYHFYYGLLLMVLALIFRRAKYGCIFFGIGAGLFIDDVSAFKYVITGPAFNPISEYWSPLFILPLMVGLFAFVLSENKLKKLFPKYEQ